MRHEQQTTLAIAPPAARAWAVPWALLGYLLIGITALLPRVLDLGGFITLDEASFWLRRSEAFLRAIQRGDWAATAISTHPGVTTMWLGAAGITLRHALLDGGWLASDTFVTTLALMRLPAALAHTAAIIIGYGLLRRMFSAPAAFLAALFWASDPFVIAYSRLLHVDALAGSFATVSLLAACVHWHHAGDWETGRLGDWETGSLGARDNTFQISQKCLPRSTRRNTKEDNPIRNLRGLRALRGYYLKGIGARAGSGEAETQNSKLKTQNSHSVGVLVLSGVAAGLALLSKSPALALLPVVGLVVARAQGTGDRGQEIGAQRGSRFAARGSRFVALGSFGLWLTVAALTCVALYPALWAAPHKALARLREGVEVEGAEPHMLGNFFLGQPQDSPDARYYPVVLALQTTPWVLAGLLLLPLAWRRIRAANRRDLAALALFALVFVVALTLFPKKFHRYMVPAFPALDVLAAVAIYDLRFTIYDWLRRRRSSLVLGSRFSVLLPGFFVVCVFNVFWFHPYEIVYANQLFGGARAQAQTFLVGWGEGIEQAATWLNAQPDITRVRTVSTTTNVLQSYMRKGAEIDDDDRGRLPKQTGYVVIYLRRVQRGDPSAPFDAFYRRRAPDYVVRIHGVEYAWVYRVPEALRR